MKKLSNILLLLFFPISFIAQTTVERNNNSWWANINKYTLSDKVYLNSEIHFRRTNFISNWQQFLIRPTLNFVINSNVHFGVGYSYIQNYPYGNNVNGIMTNENNAFFQIALIQKLKKVSQKNRFRLEERLIDKIKPNEIGVLVKNGTNYAQRLRYRYTVSFPLKKMKKEKELFCVAYDELFVNLNDNLTVKGINQNWVLMAIGYKLSKNAKIQLGYRNQWVVKGGNAYENNQILDFAFKYNFDFRKNK